MALPVDGRPLPDASWEALPVDVYDCGDRYVPDETTGNAFHPAMAPQERTGKRRTHKRRDRKKKCKASGKQPPDGSGPWSHSLRFTLDVTDRGDGSSWIV